MDEKNRIEPEKKNEGAVKQNSVNIWSNLTSSSMNLVVPCNLVTTCREDFVVSGASSSAPMVDSFGWQLWDHVCDPPLENFRYCSASFHNDSNISDLSGIRRIDPISFRSEISWNPLTPLLKGGLYAPNVPNMLPGSFCVPQFPADSGFIERAARFSCFSGGNFSGLASPFAIPESIGCYPVGPGLMTGPMIIFPSDCVKSGSELNVKAPEDVDVASREGTSLGCTQEKDGKSECVMRCHYGAEQGSGLSSNDSDEGEYSGNHGVRAATSIANDAGEEGSSKEFDLRKRKRNNGKEVESDKANEALGIPKNGGDSQQKMEHPGSLEARAQKEIINREHKHPILQKENISISELEGARQPIATVLQKEEKISERMKLLQDLVPGCSKVTGKAVMLDEIINYIQSLQRQVEFLSMKLASVNPRVDCNIEGLLAKEMLQPRAGPSTLGLSPEMMMAYPQMHLLPPGLVPHDATRRAIHGQTASLLPGAREPSQVPHNWEDELHNVIQMAISSGDTAPSGQDIDGSPPTDDVKAEP